MTKRPTFAISPVTRERVQIGGFSVRQRIEYRFPIGTLVTPIPGFGLGGIRRGDTGSYAHVVAVTRSGRLLVQWHHTQDGYTRSIDPKYVCAVRGV